MLSRWFCALGLAWAAVIAPAPSQGSGWALQRLGSLPLDASAAPAPEMSGLAYLGPSPTPGKHRFVAATENSGFVTLVDIGFDPQGLVVSAASAGIVPTAGALDFEGIAYSGPSRHTVWMVDETLPSLREFDLTTGVLRQTAQLPAAFAQDVANKSLESLTLQPGRRALWIANEEALVVDGGVATLAEGTLVRLLQLPLIGDEPVAAAQFAYRVEPVHSAGISPQSGLVDLVALPDGALIALERSFAALGSPTFLNRVFEVDFHDATDVSGPEFAAGLLGKQFTRVGKSLLWSGTSDGLDGQNLEGLALGPRIGAHAWTLVGVVDDGDPFSSPSVVSFLLTASIDADFDQNGVVDGRDLLIWQRGHGSLAEGQSHGDANRDGVVDAEDLAIWTETWGADNVPALAIPEPATLALALPLLVGVGRLMRRSPRRPKR
jgi:hypothetical protein